MRSTRALLWGLLILCLLGTGANSQSAPGSKPRKPARPVAPTVVVAAPVLPTISWHVKGWGRTKEDAVKDALSRQAAERIKEYLRRQDSPVLWLPSEPQLREYLVLGKPQRYASADVVIPNPDGTQTETECWGLQATLTPEGYRTLMEEDQRQRARLARQARDACVDERMELASWALATLLVLLLGVTFYIRLDEWSSRVYTRWIRAALLVLVVAIAAGSAGLLLLD